MLNLSVVEDKCDACVLISGDADFVPVLDILKQHKKDVLTAMTPLGYSRELISKFPYFILRKETLLRFLRDYKGKAII